MLLLHGWPDDTIGRLAQGELRCFARRAYRTAPHGFTRGFGLTRFSARQRLRCVIGPGASPWPKTRNRSS